MRTYLQTLAAALAALGVSCGTPGPGHAAYRVPAGASMVGTVTPFAQKLIQERPLTRSEGADAGVRGAFAPYVRGLGDGQGAIAYALATPALVVLGGVTGAALGTSEGTMQQSAQAIQNAVSGRDWSPVVQAALGRELARAGRGITWSASPAAAAGHRYLLKVEVFGPRVLSGGLNKRGPTHVKLYVHLTDLRTGERAVLREVNGYSREEHTFATWGASHNSARLDAALREACEDAAAQVMREVF